MADENQSSYSLLCSACYTPCSGAEAHVIPRWNPEVRRVLTTYRCGNCWLQALSQLRESVTSGEAEVLSSFCDFLSRHGYGKDAETIRAASFTTQQTHLLAIVDAVQAGDITFGP